MSGALHGGPGDGALDTVDTPVTSESNAADGPVVDDAAAVELARAALLVEGQTPGVHRRAVAEGEWAVAHYFDADLPGYRGWQWCVVLASAPGSDETTISEVVLLPGEDALLAPAWVPWSERVSAGDLGPGDELAAEPDDPRLVPNQIDTADVNRIHTRGQTVEVDDDARTPDDLGQLVGEIGLGRKRLLSREGRADAAQRWYDGDFGPGSEMARSAQFHCSSCGFYIPIAGALRPAFGICANEYAADGRAVSADYGCGAHSDVAPPKGGEGSPAYDAYDDGAVEVVAAAPTTRAVDSTAPDNTTVADNTTSADSTASADNAVAAQ